MKKHICLFFLLSVISFSTFSQEKDDYFLYRDSVFHFQFKYPRNYSLKHVYNQFLLISKISNDSIFCDIDIRISDFLFQNDKKETFMDFVERHSSSMFDADGPDESFHGEYIASIKYLKNKLNIDFIEIYELVSYMNLKLKGNIKTVSTHGPVFYFDLSSKNLDKGVVFRLFYKNWKTPNNDKDSELILRQIIDSFEFI
ncbi:MAG: hypothetical protein A2033_17180 [Bacteroidetes bacterium GWA2_31_9]|nr:MAG: hypothetical protein A2033_17180 [Bacteroidetes bacterium GWA2_31_9]